jgi:RecA-family ATPase
MTEEEIAAEAWALQREAEDRAKAKAKLRVVSSQDEIGWRGHIKHAHRLHDMRFPATAEVVPGFVPEGLSILAGRPKVGKSWMALEMALGVSMAEKVLGDTRPESGDVLYAALEDTFPRLQRRIKKLLWPPRPTWPDRLALATQWRRLDEGGVEDIADWAQSVDAPKLVILDTLAGIRPKRSNIDTQYDGDYKALVELQKLANERHFAAVVLHHTRKAESEDPLDSVSGTLGLVGCADTVLVLQPATLYLRGRDVEEAEKAITFDRANCRWKVVGNAAEVRKTTHQLHILEAMSFTEAKSIKDIKEDSDVVLSASNVGDYLRRMAKTGDVIQEKRGFFRRNSEAKGWQDD